MDEKEYSEEFAEWRTTHKPARQTCPGYQGLTLDYARNLLSDAKDAKAKEAAKRKALRLLAEMVSIPSPYQMDAAKLRQQLNPNAKNEDSFDYLVIDGNRTLEKKDYAAAAACYRKALSAATEKTDNDLLSEIRSNYVGCVHEQGRETLSERQNRRSDRLDYVGGASSASSFRPPRPCPRRSPRSTGGSTSFAPRRTIG